MKETRFLLDKSCKKEPVSSGKRLSAGGYKALKKAIESPGDVIDIITHSGLRGRGGAGFPVGLKWSMVKEAPADRKYVICNADEGEPGTGKDRLIISENPQALIEGMAIGGIAVGADRGLIYIRAEYRNILTALEKALEEAYARGYIGKNILGSTFDFTVEIRSGSGAYICGEETGLLESIEGKRGEPRLKPPFPVVEGLWAKPTVINNVETFANIPLIVNMGAAAYKKYGTEKCPGTKLFTLSGDIRNPGVYEFPFGVTIRQLFEEIGGGCPDDRRLLAVQVGGASGAIITPDLLDTPLDIESCLNAGAVLGTGSLMFVSEDVDLIDLVRNLMEFFANESCGFCPPCRIGLRQSVNILEGICEGRGKESDLVMLENLAQHIRSSSRCGMGQVAPTPLESALKNFRNVFQSRVKEY